MRRIGNLVEGSRNVVQLSTDLRGVDVEDNGCSQGINTQNVSSVSNIIDDGGANLGVARRSSGRSTKHELQVGGNNGLVVNGRGGVLAVDGVVVTSKSAISVVGSVQIVEALVPSVEVSLVVQGNNLGNLLSVLSELNVVVDALSSPLLSDECIVGARVGTVNNILTQSVQSVLQSLQLGSVVRNSQSCINSSLQLLNLLESSNAKDAVLEKLLELSHVSGLGHLGVGALLGERNNTQGLQQLVDLSHVDLRVDVVLDSLKQSLHALDRCDNNVGSLVPILKVHCLIDILEHGVNLCSGEVAEIALQLLVDLLLRVVILQDCQHVFLGHSIIQSDLSNLIGDESLSIVSGDVGLESVGQGLDLLSRNTLLAQDLLNDCLHSSLVVLLDVISKSGGQLVSNSRIGFLRNSILVAASSQTHSHNHEQDEQHRDASYEVLLVVRKHNLPP